MDRKSLPIPVPLLVLDSIGAGLLGLGLFEWFSGPALVPAFLRCEQYAQVLVLFGAALMTLATMLIARQLMAVRDTPVR